MKRNYYFRTKIIGLGLMDGSHAPGKGKEGCSARILLKNLACYRRNPIDPRTKAQYLS
jgi:hypothetical protein